MNELIFNSVHHLHRPFTSAIRQQWLTPGVSNCMAFNFKIHNSICQWLWFPAANEDRVVKLTVTDLACHVTKTAFHISLCHIKQH